MNRLEVCSRIYGVIASFVNICWCVEPLMLVAFVLYPQIISSCLRIVQHDMIVVDTGGGVGV